MITDSVSQSRFEVYSSDDTEMYPYKCRVESHGSSGHLIAEFLGANSLERAHEYARRRPKHVATGGM